MNYKDVALLNQSLDSLSENLLRRKMLQEQAAERAAQTGLQSQRLALDQSRWTSQEAHNKAMESKADAANERAQKQAEFQDKGRTLQTIMQLNTSGQLENVDDVNAWLRKDEHFAPTGIQLVKSPKPIPQAGQNSAAALAHDIDYWDGRANTATSDEQRAGFVHTRDVLQKVFDNLSEPKPAKADRNIEVQTGNAQAGEPVVKRKLSEAEYQQYQSRQPKGKPTRAIANVYVQKYGQADAIEALKKDGYDLSGYAD